MKNKRILNENEYFFWLCNLDYLSYNNIVKHNNDIEYNLYMLLNLENKGFISINQYCYNNKKIIIITKDGEQFYKKHFFKEIKSKNTTKEILDKSYKKSVDYLKKYLNNYDYEVNCFLNNKQIICKKGFGKYIIHFFTYKEYLLWKKENNNKLMKKTRNLNIITFSLNDKIKIEYDINIWILKHYPYAIQFQESGLAYSVSLINDLTLAKDYPRIIPPLSNNVYKRFIQKEISDNNNIYYHPDVFNGYDKQ